MGCDKALHARQCRYERTSKFRIWRVANNHEQRDVVSHDRSELVWLVTHPPVVRESYPTALPNHLQPGFIGLVGRKVIQVSFDG